MNRLSACIVMSIGLFFWGINSVSHAQMKSVKSLVSHRFDAVTPLLVLTETGGFEW